MLETLPCPLLVLPPALEVKWSDVSGRASSRDLEFLSCEALRRPSYAGAFQGHILRFEASVGVAQDDGLVVGLCKE